MSAGEVVGLSLTVAMLAFAVGVLVSSMRDRPRLPQSDVRDPGLNTMATYLSARRLATRASLSFVSSFRALTRTGGDSRHVRLRIKEAHSARRRLHEALDALDRAEADLVVCFPDQPSTASEPSSIDVATLRAAIGGSEADFKRLVERLRSEERRAASHVRAMARRYVARAPSVGVEEVIELVLGFLARFRR